MAGGTSVPTLAPIVEGAGRGLRRFPLTIAAGIVAATAAILLQERIGDQRSLERLLAAAGLGLSLCTGTRLLAEGRGWRGATAWIPDLVGVAVLATVFIAWPGWSESLKPLRLIQLGAVFHLFVAVAPYVAGREGPGFWEYNRSLFERIILAAVYAHVLFAGTAIAVLALDKLFGVDVSANAYLRLWFLTVFVFAPWFFVSGVPRDFAALEEETEYPRGLRAFTRFALLPIVGVYLLILTAYFAKVLVTWQWPSGWIGWLVSIVAIAGIFSLLLVHPLASRPGDRWVGTYARGFYLLLLPALVMLWLAIWQRVAQYGVTEPRYFLLGLSVWLAAVAVYQLLTRARGIRVIPASLCVVGLVSFLGPWGAYRTAERSQVGRLAGLLGRHGMLADDRTVPASGDVPVTDRREITAILEYLGRTHGYGAIAAWFPDSLRAVGGVLANTGPRSSDDTERLMRALGIRPAERAPGAAGPFYFAARGGEYGMPISGYVQLVRVNRWAVGIPPDSGWSARGDADALTLTVSSDGAAVAVFPLRPLLDSLNASAGPTRGLDETRLAVESAGPRGGRLYLRRIAGRADGGRLEITDLAGEVVLAPPR